jgi:serine/threonine protein kinase
MAAPKPDEAAIFNAARQIQTPEARRLYLQEACGEDRDLQRRVEALLRAHEEEDTFLNSPTQEFRAILDTSADEGPDTFIGPYRLIHRIGEGGMGTVFLAEQTQPVQRRVAVKIIRPGMDSRQVIARFEAERQALALMDHPHIAKILEAGTTPAGRPYFVMELIRGETITQYCDGHRLTLRERLQIFISVCQAVQHAHQKGIIHRDLKPSNVLVALYDGKATPKVIDFGIAKATGVRLTERTLSTEFGSVVGTLEYMSPEQAEPGQLDIDTRSDIYSLGALLYELLAGTTPLQPQLRRGTSVVDQLRIIREEEPPKPSARLNTTEELPTIAANRGVEPKKLLGLLRGDLDWIAMKCLEKDRTRRYATANALARDLERYLNAEPVEACPPSAGYRLRMFLKRHKGPVLAASVLFLALVSGIVGTTWGLVRADEARDAEKKRAEGERLARQEAQAAEKQAREEKQRAVEEKLLADAVREFLQKKLLGQSDTRVQADALLKQGAQAAGAARNVTVRELLDRAAAELAPEKIEANFPGQPLLQAELLRTVGRTYRALREYDLAIAFLRRAAALCRRFLDPTSSQTLDTLDDLGEVYQDAGNLQEAIPLFEQVRAAQEKQLGPDHKHTLTTLDHLAMAYQRAGNLQKSIQLLEQVRDARQKQVGPDDPKILPTLNNLAVAYRAAGKLPEAIRLLERVRDIELNKLSPDHPETLVTLEELALAYQESGRLPDAIPLFEQVRVAAEKKLGPDDPETLAAIGNLARAYLASGQLSKAIPLFEQVCAAHAKKLPADHPEALIALNNLAIAYHDDGKLPEATRLLEQVRDRQVKKLGPTHPHTLTTSNNLAAMYWKAKQLDKAIPLYEYALKHQEETLGRTHPSTLNTVANLGVAYRDAGRLEKAIPLLEEVYHKSEPQAALKVGDDLQIAYIKAGKTMEAAKLIEERLAAARQRFQPNTPQFSSALALAGKGWLDLKKYSQAESVLRECLALREKLAKDKQVRPWQVAAVRSLLGGALLGQEKYAEAAPLLEAGYEGLKQDEKAIPPQSRFLLADALSRLVEVCQATGRKEDAAKWELELKNFRAAEKNKNH